MNTTLDSQSVLRIDRMYNEYLVSSDHSAPEKLRKMLDETMIKQLPAILARMLAPLSPETDTSLWFIRRLEVETDVDAASDPDPLAFSVGSQLVRDLALCLQDSRDGDNVLWFPDRVAYVAKFLHDLVAGSAWSKWYYTRFAGLRTLPLSTALRTVLCEQPDTALAALRSLDAPTLIRAIESMSDADAGRTLDALAGATAYPSNDVLNDALHVLEHAGTAPFAARFETRRAFYWYIAAGDRADSAAFRDALVAIARWLHLRARRSSQHAVLDEMPVTSGRSGGLSAEDRALLAPLLSAGSDVLARLAALTAAGSSRRGAAENGISHTDFGGAFLLAPLLAQMPLEAATRRWPNAANNSAAALVRFFLLVKCCGSKNALRAVQDDVLGRIAGIEAPLSRDDIATWRRRISPAHRAAFLRELPDDASPSDAAGVDVDTREPHSLSSPANLEFLRLPRALGLGVALDRTLTITARELLREFASRLPGFAASNALYLQANFLNIDANIEHEPERHVVRLSRPPLHLILTMTGMFNQTYILPWLAARPFVHFPQD